MPEYDCDAISQAFISETGRFNDDELFRRNVRSRPIVDLTMEHRLSWQDGRGVVLRNLTMGRNLPLNPAAARANVGASGADGQTDACTPPYVLLKDGQYGQNYQLRHLELETPDYCLNDIRSVHDFTRVLEAKKKELAEISAWTWADWYTTDYYDLAGHNLTQQTTGAYDNGSNGYSAGNPPTAGLSLGLLEDIATQVDMEGTIPFATDEATGAASLIIIMGRAAYTRFLRDHPELRTDIRYAWMGSKSEMPTLPMGFPRKVRTFGGLVIMIDPYPRRFDSPAGAAIQPLTEVAVEKGTDQNLSAAYRFAAYEEVIVWNPAVYRSRVPNASPVNVPGWNFNPVNHMGQFEALNIIDKKCNRHGEKIFWAARFTEAAEPLRPAVGYTILIKNCGFDRSGTTCTAASSASGSGI